MLTSLKALTIDLDDTLWDVGIVIRRAERELERWLESNYPKIPGRFSREHALELRSAIVSENPDRGHDFRYIREALMRRMAAEVGYPETVADEAFAVFHRWRNTVELYDDVLPALEKLAARFPLIALTNGNADLEKVGIGHFFEATVTAVAAGAPKPHEPIFEMAAGIVGVDRCMIAHIGDDPGLDVHGAREAGLRTVWVNRQAVAWPGQYQRPDVEISHLRELADMLVVTVDE